MASVSHQQTTTAINTKPHYNKDAGEVNGMKYIRLGNTGAVVSRICLGLMSYANINSSDKKWMGWTIGQEDGEKFIQHALDSGINYFDTAEMYSDGKSEEFFGDALKKLLPQSKFTREDLVVATKIFPGRTLLPEGGIGGIQKGLSRKAIFAAVEGSLKRLQLDYIDLYFIHRYDPNTDVEETMRALHDLVQIGKIRYIGASSMFTWQFVKLQRAAEQNGWTKFSVMQNHYNAIYREEEREMIPYCLDTGVACANYSPLASGILTRRPDSEESTRSKTDAIQKSKYFKDGDEAVVKNVLEIAANRGIPPAQIALAWVLSRPVVAAPIIGATKSHHIEDAVKALQVKLTEEEIKKIESEYQPHAIAGHA